MAFFHMEFRGETSFVEERVNAKNIFLIYSIFSSSFVLKRIFSIIMMTTEAREEKTQAFLGVKYIHDIGFVAFPVIPYYISFSSFKWSFFLIGCFSLLH